MIFIPLGWGNWQGAVATITGLIAKENVVGTFGVLFGGFDESGGKWLADLEQYARVFTPLAAYSLHGVQSALRSLFLPPWAPSSGR